MLKQILNSSVFYRGAKRTCTHLNQTDSCCRKNPTIEFTHIVLNQFKFFTMHNHEGHEHYSNLYSSCLSWV